jgi:hypothetical protein
MQKSKGFWKDCVVFGFSNMNGALSPLTHEKGWNVSKVKQNSGRVKSFFEVSKGWKNEAKM